MQTPPPQFFDIFGIATFAYLAFFAFWGLKGRPFKKWEFILMLAIAFAGLAVDGWMVYAYYVR